MSLIVLNVQLLLGGYIYELLQANYSNFIICFFLGCNKDVDTVNSLTNDVYLKNAKEYISKGQTDKAIAAYKKAIEIKGSDASSHFELGNLYDEIWKKSYDVAFNKYMLDAFSNRKRDKNFIKELEKFGLKNEYKELAIHEFRETLKFSPDNFAAREYIATYNFDSKRYQEAIDDYMILLNLNPKSSNIYNNIANAYLEIGCYDLALYNLGKAFNITSDEEYYYYRLGKVYLKNNNNDKAFEMLAKLKNMKSKYYGNLYSYIYDGE